MAMRIPLNDLSRVQNRGALEGISRVAASGWYVLGPNVSQFEAEFAAYLGVAPGNCVGVASGTDALELAMKAVGVLPNSQVVMTANAGMYAASAAVRAGAVPHWVDIEESTGLISHQGLESCLESRLVSAVVVTHLYGLMAPMPQIRALCDRHSIPVVEDCAQSAGATFEGRKAGTWGDAAAFSFYPTKNLGAWGDAGAVVVNSSEVAEELRQLRQYGWAEKYHALLPRGVNSRLDELQAIVLLDGLPHLEARNERRRLICREYANAIAPSSGYRLLWQDDGSFVGHLAVIRAPSAFDRDSAREFFEKSLVCTDVHYPTPDYRQPAMAGFVTDGLELLATEAHSECVFTLPCFPELQDNEIETVSRLLRELSA